MTKIETGDRFYVTGRSKLPKMIVYFMKRYAKKYGIDYPYLYSHAGTFVRLNGELYLFESIANGFKPTKFVEDYTLNRNCMIVRSRPYYSEDEKRKVIDKALKLCRINTSYQFWGLVAWIVYIYTGVSLFGRNDVRNYCYESTFDILYYIRPHEYTTDPEIVSFFDLIHHSDEVIYVHG